MIQQAFAASSEIKNHMAQIGIWDAILSSSPVVKLTLLILVLLSVICWAVIFYKKKNLKVLKEADEEFLNVFFKARALDDIYAVREDFPKSSLARIFEAGYTELKKLADSPLAQEEEPHSPPLLHGSDNLERALRKATDMEISKLESLLGILASTGSTGPFIGLFGTVWGIMGAFQKIGATNMANLAVVAPGISEALIATAIGLVAAIPATMAYNYFLNEIKKIELEFNGFTTDYLNIIRRNFFKE